ncbi:Dimethylsulfide dehydrogenase subunit alpha [Clarias magur]|uniref:Dimethylsulfide dehydrogenase subunit alpha n=1 Tax=Clarias magur TaxID=1594786 RepID=A0A8J4X5N7_CLAMG|nr:Dimethylsulfide dehydrogenase subunit alpha [Clarias magur]
MQLGRFETGPHTSWVFLSRCVKSGGGGRSPGTRGSRGARADLSGTSCRVHMTEIAFFLTFWYSV